jgi:putative membrane protein
VQVFLIGVEPTHPWRFLGALVLISFAFVSAITAINAVFGKAAGRLLTMVLMTLQLVASNGLYPPQLQPKFIQAVHLVDPMRFSVDLVRHAMFGSSAGDPRAGQAVLALVVLAVTSWIVAAAAYRFMRVVPRKDIHPELDV